MTRRRQITITVLILLLIVMTMIVDIRIDASQQRIWLRGFGIGLLHNSVTGHTWLLQKRGEHFRMQPLE